MIFIFLNENITILEQQLQIPEVLHIRKNLLKLNRINFESSTNVLRYY